MRRFIAAIIVGVVATALICVLHASGVLLRVEMAFSEMVSPYGSATRLVSDKWQYFFVTLLAFGVAYVTVANRRRARVYGIAVALILELVSLSWVFSLYKIFFQPFPSVAAVVVAFAGGKIAGIFVGRSRRSTTARRAFAGRLNPEQIARVGSGEIVFNGEAKRYESTVLVCDIANKYELADDADPARYAELTTRFMTRASALLLEAGAYIQSSDGEGIVAIFGFPEFFSDHAERAVRAGFDLFRTFTDLREADISESNAKLDVHVGISSGSMIAAPVGEAGRTELLTAGEPVELSRRFCVANRFYGSHVLVGPRTFELANEAVIARPIDFLSGVNAQERHEIYEPLALTAGAPEDLITRRDFFWNGVVFYRERRWGEAYTEFQKARLPGDAPDAPLELYLRRLEPLALHLTDLPND